VDKEKDNDKPKASKTAKQTHSDVSNDSNNSMDLSNLMSFQKDIDEIKTNLEENLFKICIFSTIKYIILIHVL
jgi:hypothetical protein